MYIECLRDCRLVQKAILDLSWLYKNVTENRMGNQETKQKLKRLATAKCWTSLYANIFKNTNRHEPPTNNQR